MRNYKWFLSDSPTTKGNESLRILVPRVSRVTRVVVATITDKRTVTTVTQVRVRVCTGLHELCNTLVVETLELGKKLSHVLVHAIMYIF